MRSKTCSTAVQFITDTRIELHKWQKREKTSKKQKKIEDMYPCDGWWHINRTMRQFIYNRGKQWNHHHHHVTWVKMLYSRYRLCLHAKSCGFMHTNGINFERNDSKQTEKWYRKCDSSEHWTAVMTNSTSTSNDNSTVVFRSFFSVIFMFHSKDLLLRISIEFQSVLLDGVHKQMTR